MNDFLVVVNQISASFTLILAFSLFIFIVTYNRRSAIGRAFAILLACMSFVYAGDVALFQVASFNDAVPWLKFQWIGIAFMPAAYLHFSDALLRTTNHFSKVRRGAVGGSYVIGSIFLYLAIFTDLLVRDGFFQPGVTQFAAGSLFWIFTTYFFAAVLWGALNTQRARDRCLTSTTRYRMTYLMLAFAAPAFGVFPYMLVASQTSLISPVLLLTILLIVNLAIDVMLMLMGYSVSFFDAFAPDRVVRYVLGTFLLRGPLVAGLVIMVIMALPNQPIILGIPRDAVLTSLIVTIIVLAPIAANFLKPIISRLLYRGEAGEIALLRYIDTRLLTTNDLHQALENILATTCELLRVRSGFVANVAARTGPRLEASVGPEAAVQAGLVNFERGILETPLTEAAMTTQAGFRAHNDFWYIPLQLPQDQTYLGLLGVEARTKTPQLTSYEARVISTLIDQATTLLADRRLQQNVFDALRGIAPEMERAQRVRSAVRYVDSPMESLLPPEPDYSPVDEPDFPKMVHDALAHYWGGPKLTNSPLLNLNVVQQESNTYGGDQVKALRSVLAKAIEAVRPEDERSRKTPEWLLYNILELKFIQGLKVRDVANRLARSEADLYRKQKVAIEAVARALQDMELHQPEVEETRPLTPMIESAKTKG